MSIYSIANLDFKIEEGTHLIKAEEFSVVEEAIGIVQVARERATEITADAERHFQSEKERGYAEGLDEARKAALERIFDEQAELDNQLRAIESQLAALVSASVRKIVATFDDAALAEAMIKSALAKMRRESRVQLRVPVALVDTFKTRIDLLTESQRDIEAIELLEDASLQPPNVIVESGIGRVDCDLGNKLGELDVLIGRIVASQRDAGSFPEPPDQEHSP